MLGLLLIYIGIKKTNNCNIDKEYATLYKGSIYFIQIIISILMLMAAIYGLNNIEIYCIKCKNLNQHVELI